MVRPGPAALRARRATWLLLGLATATTAAGAAPRVRLQALELQAGTQGLALAVQLDHPLQPRVFRLGRPERLVLDFAHARPAAGWRLPAATGSVRALRGAAQGDGYRLVLELAPGLAGQPHMQIEAAGPGARLRLVLGVAPAEAVAEAKAAPVTEANGALRVAPQGTRDVMVVIDAGHGGEDPGASGPGGTHEKDVVLAIARALAARLNSEPGMRAVLTRDGDRLIDLRERMARARAARADLFISVHADAVANPEVAGASVYTLSWRGASSEAARALADRENAMVLKGGVELSGVDPQLASLLLDVSQSANMGASVEAADAVLGALDGVGAVRKREVQHAAFVVLKSPDVPSMLVETAYISNPAEERKLRTPEWQQRLAGAIASGVQGYFHSHPPDGTLYATQRHPAPAP